MLDRLDDRQLLVELQSLGVRVIDETSGPLPGRLGGAGPSDALFLWVRDGYKVYTDTSWAVGFGARWLLTEIEKQGIGGDRVFFGSDEPWSDFDSEYWKLNGIRNISQELKDRVFWGNYEEAFGTHA